MAGPGPWILPDFLDQRVKFFKNHKIKNTPSILISFKTIKKLQKNQKSENFVFCDDFRDSSARRLGINHFLKNIDLRVTNDMKTRKVHDFSWDDHGFLFLRTWKTHFLFCSLLKFVTLYCFDSNDEKTVKSNKNHQMHPNWRQNWVTFKKSLKKIEKRE